MGKPEFEVGQRVDHRSVPCKRAGLVENVRPIGERFYYVVRFASCTAEFAEDELRPAGGDPKPVL